jgi:replicative DNA helicase
MNHNDLPVEEFSYSHEAECSVIGAVLSVGPDAYDAANLTAPMFFQPLHQTLWTELEKLVLAGKHVDVVALMESMRGADVDWNYVQNLTGSYVSVRAARGHAQVIRDYAKARGLKAAARAVVEVAADESLSIEQRVSQSVTKLEAVIEERTEKDVLPVADFVADFLDRLQAMADGDLTPSRPTHIPTLDGLLSGGFRDEQLVIVAARPSVGKSSFAQQLALSLARDGIPAAFFGMEMTSRELTNRTVANVGRAPLSGLKTGKMDEDEWSRVTEGVEALRNLPLYLYDQPAMTLAEVASKARKAVRRHGVKALVVDYLQLMKGSGFRAERRVELEEITRGMKQLAKQLGITVFLLSQLNREVEKRANPRPVMSDLKECGAIEEDADVILGLWTHRKGDEGQGDIKGCVVLKNRDGQTGEVALHFSGAYQRWGESTESLAPPIKSAPAKGSKYAEDF